MSSKICPTCKKVFFKTPNLSKKYWETKRKFCSNRCKMLGKTSHMKGKKNQNIAGNKHPLWKGNKVGYGALHIWIRRNWGKPKVCDFCESTKNVQWASKNQNYTRKRKDWLRLCISCHKKYDNKANNRVAWNKGLKGEEYEKHYPDGIKGPSKGNIPWNKSDTYLICPICKKKFHTSPSAVKAGRRFCSKKCYWKSPAQKKGAEARKSKWSMKFDKCISCGKTKNKHRGKGLCTKCYMKKYYNQNNK